MSDDPKQGSLPLGAPARPPPRVSTRPGDKGQPLTVEALVRVASMLMDQHIGTVWVEGEVSALRVPSSGHVYFNLKDEGAQLPAVMWRSTAQRQRFRLEEGKRFLVRGKLAVYPEQGRLQLYVEMAEPAGLGEAAVALAELRKKLAEEGLFDPRRKRALPRLPRRIGVVTSPTGAAVGDIIRVISRRFPTPILLSPAKVQGEGAAAELCAAVQLLWGARDVDVIIVGRGGGSAEDLSAFNDEALVRVLARSPVPVISAVGHEIDVTLADLVADVRAATPTAAGELCVPERAVMQEALARLEARLGRETRVALGEKRRSLERLQARQAAHDPRRRLARERQKLDELVAAGERALRGRLAAARRELGRLDGVRAGLHPRAQLGQRRAALATFEARLGAAAAARVDQRRQGLAHAAARLDAMSPLKVLERGYAVARTMGGQVLTSFTQATLGESIRVILRRGELGARVEEIVTGSDPARKPRE